MNTIGMLIWVLGKEQKLYMFKSMIMTTEAYDNYINNYCFGK
jgi:hypothetical protein